MNESRTISVDLAKDVFEVAIADGRSRNLERKRLSRGQFERLLGNSPPAVVLFESCGTAHFWARTARSHGHEPRIIPAQYVRPYRRRNKTDRADCEALLEAERCAEIKPVPVRSVEQQQIQQLHRLREQWKKTRTARINALRGALRELGFAIAEGARLGKRHIRDALDAPEIPLPLATMLHELLVEVAQLEERIKLAERQLHALTRDREDVQRLRLVPGIGPLTSTALVAAAGSPHHFRSGRHLAAWLGITPRVRSSGNRCHLGPITKQGDKYLRMLIIHGARSVLARAKQMQRAQKPLPPLTDWAVRLKRRVGHNKATVALANKLARIAWATWKYERAFEPNWTIA